ncbi:MAG: glycoside hydrolase domain-containing protein [Myxococcota bacterium]
MRWSRHAAAITVIVVAMSAAGCRDRQDDSGRGAAAGDATDDSSSFELLPGTITPLKPGARGVDRLGAINARRARALRADGIDFAVRYVRHASSNASLTTRKEAEGILGAGLTLMLVQEGRGFRQTRPSAELGERDARAAVAHAEHLGYPRQGTLWLDMEAITAPGTTADDVMNYARRWHEVVDEHYSPGYYVGPVGKLDGDQLGSLPFEHFWKSAARVPTPTGRGYQLLQGHHREIAGVVVDPDTAQDDDQGGRALGLSPPSR